MKWLFYIVSMLYTIMLIVTVGLTLFEAYFNKGVTEELKARQKAHRTFSVKLLFVLVICSIFEQTMMWLDQFGADRFNFSQLFFGTLTGQVWLVIFAIVLIGLFIQKSSTVFLSIWALMLLLAESVDGHISALDSYAILFDFVHLLCAAIWAGGIATFILNWKKFKPELLALMQSFMKVIWLTVIIMSLSGIALTILIVPDYLYLLYSAWGQWLILKIVLVAIALCCGYVVRKYVKKNELPLAKALVTEAMSLVVVLALAGVITGLNPEPSMNSIDYHKMGEELHYTIELSPNRPGPNELTLTLWTLEEEGVIESVKVELWDLEKGERTKRTLLLSEVEQDEPYDFMGFIESKYTYENELRLPYPSTWQKDVTITFTSGKVRMFSYKFDN